MIHPTVLAAFQAVEAAKNVFIKAQDHEEEIDKEIYDLDEYYCHNHIQYSDEYWDAWYKNVGYDALTASQTESHKATQEALAAWDAARFSLEDVLKEHPLEITNGRRKALKLYAIRMNYVEDDCSDIAWRKMRRAWKHVVKLFGTELEAQIAYAAAY